jgi:V/A-type H+/Na+-transporting ATPase subunit A
MAASKSKGQIYRVSGPVVTATGITPRMYDIVRVGDERLMGEVIEIDGDKSIIQVYEDTSGIKPCEPVENTGIPLAVELGPGLLTSIYDGIQRPLEDLQSQMGDFIKRGVDVPGLDHAKKWDFKATAKAGDAVAPGTVLGTVQETKSILHKIMVPPNVKAGKLKSLKAGSFTVDDVIGTMEDGTELRLMHRWPVRSPRPFKEKLLPDVPLNTGQRILDGLFPLAKGGTAAIPGPFGSGKTVTQQQLAKWSDAQIVVYIGCGERGNEMTEVLTEFPHLTDPKSGNPLTIAEYYRDMGYDVALMADSTSRWAEAMREISSRLEEMPGEEGYPAYLAARLSEFYERAGRTIGLNKEAGSVSVIGAVSPPGGDFSEPVTQNTLRIVKVFWALDAKLAQRRHFPAINWLQSYSLYSGGLAKWYSENVAPDWNEKRAHMMDLLQKEAELQDIVQLVGSDALPEPEQLTLEVSRMIREFFLQQNAYHDVDTYASLKKQYKMVNAILGFEANAKKALAAGVSVREIAKVQGKDELNRSKFEKNFEDIIDGLNKRIAENLEKLGRPQLEAKA